VPPFDLREAMIISVDDRRGSRWPVPLVLAALCGLAVFGAGFLQQRALDAKIADQKAKAVTLARQVVAPVTKDLTLTKPLPHSAAIRLDHALEKGPLSGGAVLRVRIFAQDGTLLYSTDPDDGANGARVGDATAIRAASGGSTSSSVGTDRVSAPDGKALSAELLQIYAPLSGGKGDPPAAVGVDQRYDPIVTASQQPWHMVQQGSAAAAAILVVICLLLVARRVSVKRAANKARAPAAPKPAKDAPAPEPDASEKERRKPFRKEKSSGPPGPTDAERARKDAQREMQVREALEGQLEQLRTRIREGEDLANRQVLELTQQLQVAAARIEDAEARAAAAPVGVDAERMAAAERQTHETAQRAEQAEARASVAEARVAELEERLADAHRSTIPPPTDERVAELERALAEARTEAADSARRAEATEAVREELETKVAQFGSRAQEQEATATALAGQLREIEAVRADLERRASEAESGGDAVRSVVAQLTAERDSLRARVTELEQAPDGERPTQAAAGIEELEQLASARAELHDLRQQLGHAIERARAAEERGAKLEADLLAERQGVRELSDPTEIDAATNDPVHDEAAGDVPTDDPANPFPWMNGNGNGAASNDGSPGGSEPEPSEDGGPQGDKSLRYRLAQSAARKKGLGEIDLPS
jgi:hypothetical protein